MFTLRKSSGFFSVAALISIIMSLSACGSSSSSTSTMTPVPPGHQIEGEWWYGSQPVWGDVMVAIELGHDANSSGPVSYLSTYNFLTQEKMRLLQVPADRIYEQPAIYKDKIIWAALDRKETQTQPAPDYNLLNWDIFLYNLTTGEMQQITTDVHAQTEPHIYADTIVWLDNRNTQTDVYPPGYDVYAYDLTTRQERRLTSSPTVEGYSGLGISNYGVVWTDMRHTDQTVKSHAANDGKYNNEIYVYDLSANQEHRITTSAKNDRNPCISDSLVVWLRQDDFRSADIFAYDLASSTGREIQISKSGFAAGIPSVSSGNIVWQDARASLGNTSNDVIENGQAGAADIYLYNPNWGMGTKLTEKDGQGHQLWSMPVVSGNRLLYSLDRQVGPVTYTFMLPENK